MNKIVLAIFLIFSSYITFSQNTIDQNGLKQGFWQENYQNGEVRYQGVFKDDLEQGLFKFFYTTGELKATKEFFNDSRACATHIFYRNGNIRASCNYWNVKSSRGKF